MAAQKHISKHAKKEEPHVAGSFFKFLLKLIGVVLLVVVVAAGAGIAYLTYSEYKPADIEKVPVEGESDNEIRTGKGITVMTWNIGYGALGDNADFFMDGGKGVKTADTERVNSNMAGILDVINNVEPDILFTQEVDIDSARSNNINEYKMLQDTLPAYTSSFAANYRCRFVPFPVPPIGKVDSGLASFSKFTTDSAARIQLPIPFKWPVRVANLKRCILESRIPVKGSDKELVLMNLHVEAYDNGEGKIAQTKMLAERMKEEMDKGNYVIVGGDFNQIFSNADTERYPVEEGLWAPGKIFVENFDGYWHFLMDEDVPSCRSLDKPYVGEDMNSFQYYLIDGFIVSDNITIKSCKNKDLGFECSDHNPVVLKIMLK